MKYEPSDIPVEWLELLQLIPGYDCVSTAEDGDWFDSDLAQDAISFFSSYLTLTKSAATTDAGQPFNLQPWQAAIVGNVFGWQRLDEYGNVVRRYREVFIGIPRKNGKTEMTAGLGCLGFFWDKEEGAEVYCAAKDRGQAGTLFKAAKTMVMRSKGLHDLCSVYRNSITIEADHSSFKPISADAEGQHSTNPHIAIIDELHVQPNGDLLEALETGQGARRQPLLIYLTTSDYDRAGSICNDTWDHARGVRDGHRKASRFLPVIYEADDKDDDWRDEEVWKRVNPNLGISVSIDFLRDKAKKAEQLPRLINSFKRLYLNIRTGQSEQWLNMDYWDDCDGSRVEFLYTRRDALERELRGEKCWIGADLSQKHDMTAVVCVFKREVKVPADDIINPDEVDPKTFYWVLPYFFLPEATIKEPKRDPRKKQLWQQWKQEGWLSSTPGETVQYDYIRRHFNRLREIFNVQQVGLDRWNAEKTAQELEADGFNVGWFTQGYSAFSGPTKEFERAVIDRRIVHGGNPVLREQARVAAADVDASENVKPSKKKSGDKIDGIVATIMGIGLAMMGEGNQESVYEHRGFKTVG